MAPPSVVEPVTTVTTAIPRIDIAVVRPALLLHWSLALLLLAAALLQVLQLLYRDSLQGWTQNDAPSTRAMFDKMSPLLTVRASQAMITANRDNHIEALHKAHHRHLINNPANAHAWHRYAVDLHRARQLDDPVMIHAVERAMTLAPNSRSLGISQAIIAAWNWNEAPPELRESWQAAYRAAALAPPTKLVYQANLNGVIEPLCASMGEDIRPVFCQQDIAAIRALCERDTLTPRQLRYCLNIGMRLH